MLFIGGIHGVGKSVFCKKISEYLNIPHFSSSELINKQKKENLRTDKKVADAEKNQDFLLDALDKQDVKGGTFLLDGHFCLLNKEGSIVKISEETFEKLSPNVLIVLTNDPAVICERLFKRDGVKYDLHFLSRFQTKEIEYANELSVKLDVPICILNSDNMEQNKQKVLSAISYNE